MYEVFVGSNNTTKKLEVAKIHKITARYYDGATFTQSVGVWKGEKERSMKIEVLSSKSTLKNYLHDLKVELKQEAIAYRKVKKISLFF